MLLVVAIDMPAFGYSDKSEDARLQRTTTKIQWLFIFYCNKLIKHTPKKKWHLVGHSMGGITIGQFA
jgi:pimeloyl-ACP methyl ester carboxylesterase